MKLTGTSRPDRLIGTDDDDVLIGRKGRDLLDGRGGADVMKGGPGRDVFVVSDDQALDVIRDFKPGKDILIVVGATQDDGGYSFTYARTGLISVYFDSLPYEPVVLLEGRPDLEARSDVLFI